jgi:hypothetical protein
MYRYILHSLIHSICSPKVLLPEVVSISEVAPLGTLVYVKIGPARHHLVNILECSSDVLAYQ